MMVRQELRDALAKIDAERFEIGMVQPYPRAFGA